MSPEDFTTMLQIAERIRLFSKPPQWHFVKTVCNPADVATRSINATQLKHSECICGLMEAFKMTAESGFDLVNPGEDAEIRRLSGARGYQPQARSEHSYSFLRSVL